MKPKSYLWCVRSLALRALILTLLGPTVVTAATFATFSLPAGTPLGFQVRADGSFTNINAAGDPAILNFVNAGALAGSSYATYLTVSGQLNSGAGATVGGNLLQGFQTLRLQFWSQPGQTGSLILDCTATTGTLCSNPPFNSAGVSTGGVVGFTSDVQPLSEDLNNLFGANRAMALNLNALIPSAAISMGNLQPFRANIGGSFSGTSIQ